MHTNLRHEASWGVGGSECAAKRRISYYVSFRAEQGQLKPTDRRAVKLHKAYCKAAKDTDSKYHHTPDDENDPAKSALLSFGPVAGMMRIRFSGSASAASESYLLDSMTSARERSSHAIVRYPTLLATTTSRSPKEGIFRSKIRRV